MDEELSETVLLERSTKQNYLTTEIIEANFDSDLFMWHISSLKEAHIDLWSFEELQQIVQDFKAKYLPGQTLDSIQGSDSSTEAKQQYLHREIIEAGYNPDFFVAYIEKLKNPDLAEWTLDELKAAVKQFKDNHLPEDGQQSPINLSNRNSFYGDLESKTPESKKKSFIIHFSEISPNASARESLDPIKIQSIEEHLIGKVEERLSSFKEEFSASERESEDFSRLEGKKETLEGHCEEKIRCISPFPLHKTMSSDGNIVFEPVVTEDSHSFLGACENEVKAENVVNEESSTSPRKQFRAVTFEPMKEDFYITVDEEQAGTDVKSLETDKLIVLGSIHNENLCFSAEENAEKTDQEKDLYNTKEIFVINEKTESEPSLINFLSPKFKEEKNIEEGLKNFLSPKFKEEKNIEEELKNFNNPKIKEERNIDVNLSETGQVFDFEVSEQILNSPKFREQEGEAVNEVREVGECSHVVVVKCQSTLVTEITFLSDLKFICSPCSFRKDGFFSIKYLEYQIDIPELGWSVKRSFKDFLWLRSALIFSNPGSYIPPIPMKSLKKRPKILNLFIKTILRDPKLRSSPEAIIFLQDSKKDIKTFKKTEKIPKKLESFDQISSIDGEIVCDFSEDSSLLNTFQDYLDVSINLDHTFKLTSKNIIKATQKLSKDIEELADIMGELQKNQVGMLGDQKNEEKFENFKNCLVKWAAHEEINAKNSEGDLKEFFGYRAEEMIVLKTLICDRDQRLKRFNRVKKGKDLNKIENFKKLFGHLNFKVKSELDRVLGDYFIYDLEYFKELAEYEIDKSESLRALWLNTADLFLPKRKLI